MEPKKKKISKKNKKPNGKETKNFKTKISKDRIRRRRKKKRKGDEENKIQ